MQHDWQDVQQAALGQWPDILKAHGVSFRPKRKNGPCPLCGGNDRAHFRESDGRVLLYCRHCGTHWADSVLLDLAFAGDFNRMCNELGDWLHVRPAEAKTQAKVAAASDVDSVLLASRMNKAKKVYQQTRRVTEQRHGIEFPAFALMDGIAIPLKLAGKLCDWIYIVGDEQEVIEGEPVPGSAATLKGSNSDKRPVITPRFMDAVWLHHLSKGETTVICTGTLENMRYIASDMRHSIVAIPNTIDALEAIQTISNDFMIPDEKDKPFCASRYQCKPKRVIPNGEAGKMYYERIDNE